MPDRADELTLHIPFIAVVRGDVGDHITQSKFAQRFREAKCSIPFECPEVQVHVSLDLQVATLSFDERHKLAVASGMTGHIGLDLGVFRHDALSGSNGPELTGAGPHAGKYSAREVATRGTASGAAWS